MIHRVTLALSAALALGCGNITVATTGAGRAGDTCTKTTDCGAGLHCVGTVCTADEDATVTEPPPADDTATEETPPVEGHDRCGLGECPDDWLGDGYCNAECNCEAASFDNGDCGNACKGAEDEAALAAEGFDDKPLECWQGCAGNPELSACTSMCIQALGVTVACSDCVAAAVDCTMSSCGDPCQDQQSAPCAECAEASCGVGFRNCSGLQESAIRAVP